MALKLTLELEEPSLWNILELVIRTGACPHLHEAQLKEFLKSSDSRTMHSILIFLSLLQPTLPSPFLRLGGLVQFVHDWSGPTFGTSANTQIKITPNSNKKVMHRIDHFSQNITSRLSIRSSKDQHSCCFMRKIRFRNRRRTSTTEKKMEG